MKHLISSLFLILFISSTVFSSPTSIPRFTGKFASNKLQKKVSKYNYETRYFKQQLDHFSFTDAPTFRQRYLVNFDHWSGANRRGPFFMYCGNEGDITWFAESTGFVWEIAPRFGAMVLFPEHRYYGESMPYGSRKKAYKNATTLAYLTAEQALADYAVLIREVKRNLSAEACPVVLFGGSYGGMLAAWMRLKYPHVAIGALASSAPILQFENIVPPETFFDIVSYSFKRESRSCFNTIKKSWDELTAVASKANGLIELTKTFRLCSALNTVSDLSDWLRSAYAYLAMVNYPYPANFLEPLPGHPVKEVCRSIDTAPDGHSILGKIFAGASIFYNYTGTVKCYELGEDSHGMTSGWEWQACTEMVMPMSISNNSMFSTYDYDYNSFQEGCWDSLKVRPRRTWITTQFGGHDFKTTIEMFGSNIIFSNGLLDPWSGGSVLHDVSDTVVALVTKEGAHHLDLRAATANDPEWLIKQREDEIKIIKGWISDYYKAKKGLKFGSNGRSGNKKLTEPTEP